MKKVLILSIVAIIILAGLFFAFGGIFFKKNGNFTENIKPIYLGKIIDLSGQSLNKLPPYVLLQSNLEELNISNNLLDGALPAEIKNLRNLRILNARNNQMTGIPAEMGQMQNLEIIDFSNNKITGLPNELANLKNLKILNLSGNQYSEQDLNYIKSGLPKTVNIITE